MASQASRAQVSRDVEATVKRKAAEFQEAPGEAEADAVRDAFLKGAGPEPQGVASALSGADSAARARTIGRLQRERGNAFVQRVVSESRGEAGRMVGMPQSEMVSEVQQRQGGGSPLPDDTRSHMEGFLGADFGDVRVHTDGEAASLNRELSANAFTVGRDVFFSEGQYNPGSRDGQATLAHELTHVTQQTGVTPPAAQREGEGAESEEEQVQMMALQREGAEEEEQVQAMAVQREGEGAESEEEEA